ncbi:hypothetical protein PKOR_05025 [Pontibacter korlensis]|uniref:SH3b domain-containing protein n=1 Tax=Pontibacter korlensis TaxID=400092 RepID=A0A0E3ZHG0_9BACT|nr:hypothetical protein PKOR_05025 [Pontibacter korlensis]
MTCSFFCLSSCSGGGNDVQDGEQVTIASETGQPTPLPADVIYSAKPLINGRLYSKPNFEASSLAYFDTAQSIHILDTSNTMFVRARILQDTSSYTGYVPKTILPEQKQ